MSTVYLVSGANRGIGLGLVEQLAKRADAVVYAGARDVSNATELHELARSHANVKPVKLISTDLATNKAVAEQIKTEHGHLDVVVANAGVGHSFGSARDISLDAMRDHVEINTLGPLMLFQQVAPLLTGDKPTFTVVSTSLASLSTKGTLPDIGYATSKTAVNMVTKHIHDENPAIAVAALHPGWVATDMGNTGARYQGLERAPVLVEDCAKGLVKVIDELVPGGETMPFIDFQGKTVPF